MQHDWKKLRAVWKSVNAKYKAALSRYTISGTHDSDFYTFCNGKLEIYYLRKHLELRPELNATVKADLPHKCAVLSDREFVVAAASTTTRSDSSDKENRARNKRAKRTDCKDSQLAAALNNFATSQMKAELSKENKVHEERGSLSRTF